MGQGASHGEHDRSRTCCNSSTDSAAPNKSSDTVKITKVEITSFKQSPGDTALDVDAISENVVAGSTLRASSSFNVPQQPIQRPRAFQPLSSFSCGFGPAVGPDVSISAISSHNALVSWTYASRSKMETRRWHIEVLAGSEAARNEIAFFETAGDQSSFELPVGTLKRHHGPYCVQVASESGPEGEKAIFSSPGTSRSFWTPPEAPCVVGWPRLAEPPTENTISLEWEAPEDDGGCPVKEYKIALCKDVSSTLDSAKASISKISTWSTDMTCHTIDGLPPGGGPYRIEICAYSEADLVGPTSFVVARTAVAEPGPPLAVRAQLKPVLTPGDADTMRLEFLSPLDNGGQELHSFLVSVLESHDAEVDSKSQALRLLREVPYEEAVQLKTSRACVCDVPISPNQAHTLVVQASNGERTSVPSEPSQPVFVPAHVPAPPSRVPEVRSKQGGFAELRWKSPETGGGLPIMSFKVGIQRCAEGFDFDASKIWREVTVTKDAAHVLPTAEYMFESEDEDDALVGAETLELWGTEVGGLDADTRYRFVIAASNRLGTGCWSAPSAPVSTPVAAPSAPANPVATIALDAQRRTAVTVAWEPGHLRTGSGAVVAFHLTLILEQAHDSDSKLEKLAWGKPSKHSEWQCGKVLYERLPLNDDTRRMSWTAPLMQPGRYRIEVTSENTMGQRSSPAVLAINASKEAFAPPEKTPQAPHWADEPFLLRGGAEKKMEKAEQFLPHVDGDDREWLQTLLLWDSTKKKDPWSAAPSSVDLLCFYRRPDVGPSDSQVAVLGKSITASRLQVALPTQVPMSFRLAARNDSASSGTGKSHRSHSDMPQSEALLVLLGEGGQPLSARWEVWSRQAPSGKPPSWVTLPEAMHSWVETAWIEGKPTVEFTVPCKGKERSASIEGEDFCDIAPGLYQIQFGDERRVQHTAKRLGSDGWQAKARRTVCSCDGEEVKKNEAVDADDQCIICFDGKRTHAFMHADTGDGHLAICASCAETFRAENAAGNASRALRACPVCRRPFTSVQRIFK